MKKYRTHCPGYILLYVLAALSCADALYTLIGSLTGTLNEAMASFSLFSYLIAIFALLYVRTYARSKVVIGDGKMRVVFPVNVQPKPGEKRASILFRQGGLDLNVVDKTIELNRIVRYGYVEDLGYEKLDRTGTTDKNKLFPVHEVAIITNENKRYHMNAGIYNAAQLRGIFSAIAQESGVSPEGALAEVLKG